MDNKTKPFSMEYVLNATTKHMLKSVDISIRKTLERISEFAGNQEKSQEVFKTLAALEGMKRGLNNGVDSIGAAQNAGS
jgi:hypothetical protein